MLSKDIKVGETYAYSDLGTRSRHSASPGSKWIRESAVVLSTPVRGRVEVRLSSGQTMQARTDALICTLAEHEQAAAEQSEQRARQIERQWALDARACEILGADVYEEREHYIAFKVHGDGSYDACVRRMERSTFLSLLEAAYEAGRAAR